MAPQGDIGMVLVIAFFDCIFLDGLLGR